MAENVKKDMGTGSVKKWMVKLAVPALVGQLVNLLYNIVDRIYIGHLPGIGADALTGVGLFTPILMLITAFARPDWKTYSASVSVITGFTGHSFSSKYGPFFAVPRQCSSFTRITSGIGEVKVTVSAAWFITPPRWREGTDGAMILKASAVIVAS